MTRQDAKKLWQARWKIYQCKECHFFFLGYRSLHEVPCHTCMTLRGHRAWCPGGMIPLGYNTGILLK